MTKLRCSAVHCEYNSDHYCCRSDIRIGGGESATCSDQTCCDSFRERTNKTSNAADCRTPNPRLSVACSVSHCQFNNCGACFAKSVQVSGVSAQSRQGTQCETFACDTASGCCNH